MLWNYVGSKLTNVRVDTLADQIIALSDEEGIRKRADQKGYYRGVDWATEVAEKALIKVYKAHETEIIEAKREERERIAKDIHSIEFESDTASDFLNKTLYYVNALKEGK